jgi:putative flippase GtrA
MSTLYSIANFFLRLLFKKEMSRSTFGQLVKHYSVQSFASLVNYAGFNILVYMGLDIKLSNAINTAFVIALCFVLQKFFTYRPDNHSIRQPILFLLSSFIYYLAETAILVVLIQHLMISPMISKLISMACLSPLSFLFQKFIIFRNKKDGKIQCQQAQISTS